MSVVISTLREGGGGSGLRVMMAHRRLILYHVALRTHIECLFICVYIYIYIYI